MMDDEGIFDAQNRQLEEKLRRILDSDCSSDESEPEIEEVKNESPSEKVKQKSQIEECIDISSEENHETITISDSDGESNTNQLESDTNNVITLTLQDGNKRNTKTVQITKDQPVLLLKIEYSKLADNVNISTLKFMFDGDLLDDRTTLEELDIDDGCVIDVIRS